MVAMKNRWWITAPNAWAGVVALVALVAWWVIDDAGQRVLAQPAREVITPTPDASVPPPTVPETATDSPEQPAQVKRTSTWQGEEGLLRVSCRVSELQLEGATPQDGYEIDKNDRRSGSEIEVRFRSIDGDRRVEIEARCAGGVPAFAVERD